MNSLDSILSGRTDAPVQETQETTTQAAAETTEAAEQTTEQQAETQEAEPGKDGKPPIGAIRQAEREKATKKYTEQVADFEKKLSDQNEAWERRFNKLLETVGPKPEPKPAAPDIFENPNGAILHTVQPHLQEVRSAQMYNSRLIAEVRHTDALVNEAEAAFSRAYESGRIDPADAHKVLSSPNIYDAAVKWHKRRQAEAEIGDDPAAFREKVKAEILAELQAQPQTDQTQQPGKPAPVMPSNFATARNVGSRAGPAWAGPTPLADIFNRKR